MHFEKVFEFFDTIIGEGHDGVFADTIDPDDTVLGLESDRHFMQGIFIDAELLGDCGDDGDGVDLVALPVQAAAAMELSSREDFQFQGSSSLSR